MDLEYSFAVPADVDAAWRALLDVPLVAACMPGVTVSRVEGPAFTGCVKVKLGPVTLTYHGEGRFTAVDDAARHAVVEGFGLDARGNAPARASVSVRVVAEDAARTRVDVAAVVAVEGTAAQFGHGAIAEAARRLIDQFAGNLGYVLTAGAQDGAA